MPDFRNLNTVDIIHNNSSILPIGCELEEIKNQEYNSPIILWNHRWEHDKNPELFFNTLIKLKKNNIKFNVVNLGQKFT